MIPIRQKQLLDLYPYKLLTEHTIPGGVLLAAFGVNSRAAELPRILSHAVIRSTGMVWTGVKII